MLTDPSLIPTGDKMFRRLPADAESNSDFNGVQFDVEYNAEQDAMLEHSQCEGIGLDEMTDELVLHRAAAILHKRVKTMAYNGLKSSQRLPAADVMTTGSVSDLSVPQFLFSIITGDAYVPQEAEACEGRSRHWKRSLSLTHDLTGCAGYVKNASGTA